MDALAIGKGNAQEVFLSISDDGHGFEKVAVSGEHLGLNIMRERTELGECREEQRAAEAASKLGPGLNGAIWPGASARECAVE